MPLPTALERGNDSVRAATVARGSDQTKGASSNNSEGVAGASVDVFSAPSPQPDSNAMLISRPTIIGAMKPRRGPSAPIGQQRITRSCSMKEQRVKSKRVEIEDTTVEGKGYKQCLDSHQ